MSATADLFTPDEAPLVYDPRELSLTEEEWARVLNGRKFQCLVNAEQVEWAGRRAVRCGNCTQASGSHKVPWSGFCRTHRVMVSDTFLKLCREHTRA